MHFLNDPKEQERLRQVCNEHDVPYELVRELLKEAKDFDQFVFGANERLTNSIGRLIERHSKEEQ